MLLFEYGPVWFNHWSNSDKLAALFGLVGSAVFPATGVSETGASFVTGTVSTAGGFCPSTTFDTGASTEGTSAFETGALSTELLIAVSNEAESTLALSFNN